MIDRQSWSGRDVHPRGTSAVEIRLVVLAVIVALLAILPAVAGAQEVGGVMRLIPDLPLVVERTSESSQGDRGDT